MTISITNKEITLGETVGANLFVGIDGKKGGSYGVVQSSGDLADVVEIRTIGETYVVAGSENLVAGDMVIADTDGTALKANSTTTTISGEGGDVVVDHTKKYFLVIAGADSGDLATILLR